MSYGYAIESSKNKKLFKRAHTWSQDDPFPLSDFGLRVIDSEKAYFLTYTTFGVTLNGGDKWLINPLWEVVEYPNGMPKVEINDEGVGEIFVPSRHDGSGKVIYSTTDFGVSWKYVGNE